VNYIARQVSSNLILIVDDQPANLKVLRRLFANIGHQLTFATNGQQALERVQATRPNLILLDLMLPDMSGLEVCQELKKSEETANIPIIFLTVSNELEHLLKAFEQGAVDYVTKPFRSSELLTRVQHHLLLQNTQAALSELNQHLEDEVQQRTAQLQQALTFAGISQRITERVRDSLDETQILSTVVSELTHALDLDRMQTGIYDLEQETSTVTQKHSDPSLPNLTEVNRFADFQDIYSPLLQGQTIQLLLPATCQHLLLEDAAFLACPLWDERQIIGDLWLYRFSQVPFSEAEIQLVESVAAQSAIAIRQARLYKASQAQVKELERVNYVKDDFLKTISHELKTPLTTIKAASGTLGLLFKQPDWQEQYIEIAQESLQFLNEGCDREIQIVNHLLELVHLDIGTSASSLEPIDLDMLIHEVVRFFEQRLQQKSQALNIEIQEPLPLLLTNTEMLERILNELFTNACKYTPQEGTIEVAVMSNEHEMVIAVSNSGVVVPEQELVRIFETFYRLPQTDRWKHDGIGIGLALVKKQVEYLKGSISAHCSNQRFTMQITLPVIEQD